MNDSVPAGPALDAIGAKLSLGADDRLTEALIIAKATNLDTGTVSLILGGSEDLDWIAMWGLHTAAREAISASGEPIQADDDDDD